MRLIAILTCACAIILTGCADRVAPVGPPPVPATATQLARLDGVWELKQVQPQGEELPFNTIAIESSGAVVSVGRMGATASLVRTEYQRPYPGGAGLRATFAVTLGDAAYSIWIDWPDDPKLDMFGQLRGGHLDGFRMLHVSKAESQGGDN
jgi:hypothetical protein